MNYDKNDVLMCKVCVVDVVFRFFYQQVNHFFMFLLRLIPKLSKFLTVDRGNRKQCKVKGDPLGDSRTAVTKSNLKLSRLLHSLKV